MSLKLLNAAGNYTVARKGHRVSNIRWIAIDSGASGNYYPSHYIGENHNPLATKVTVGCANDAAIKSQAQDTIRYRKLPTKAKICHKFDEITTPLISVSQLCKNKMTVTFNDKGVLVNNSEGEMVIRGHLDLSSNLYIVPADDTVQYKAPKKRNIVEILQHRASIAYIQYQMCTKTHQILTRSNMIPSERDVGGSHSKGMVHHLVGTYC